MSRRAWAAFGVAFGILVSTPAAAQFDSVGFLDFSTSARSVEAQRHFLRGVAILHSFGWEQAIEQFQAAQRLEPDFVMAYWGETLCYNHPLFAATPDDAGPRGVLARLGPDRASRLAKAPTDRERGFLEAVEILWGDGAYNDRRVAYMEAMRRLYERYPDDDEVGAFYAVSLLSAARALGDRSLRFEIRAGAISLAIFGRKPDHPGAPHYAIHAFDDPIHAPLALPAARRYAEIAPAVSHARHMPTHIFIQHGMWDLVSTHNQSAYDAAQALWSPGESVGDTVHSLDWGQYGDLQRGDYVRARTWIERLEQVIEDSDGAARAVGALSLLRARYVVETEEWRVEPVTPEATADTLLATTLSAAALGDLATARQAVAGLERRANGGEGSGPRANVEIMHKQAAAALAVAEGRPDSATELMDEVIAVVESRRLPNGAASPVKPPFELYGELLLQLGRPDAALERFERSLLRMPNRLRSLLGAARAAKLQGDTETARDRYRTVVEMWAGASDDPSVDEARRFLAAHP